MTLLIFFFIYNKGVISGLIVFFSIYERLNLGILKYMIFTLVHILLHTSRTDILILFDIHIDTVIQGYKEINLNCLN